MELENEKKLNTTVDSAYGGCKYRLSYDAAEIKRENETENKSVKPRPVRFFNWLVLAFIFIVLGVFILSYYNNEVKKIFGHSNSEASEKAAHDYSNVNVIVD